ncbi:hypothetical protein SLS62_007483 [Diatrype stigma]|uniref:NodB homology domain-containing protein n=1 Tax=Diatrype stigma TaxID=117547 RepID=A0AAN9YNE3_9PEZI
MAETGRTRAAPQQLSCQPRSRSRRRLHVTLTVDFDAVSGLLGTGHDPRNNLADLSGGVFSAKVGVRRLLRLFERFSLADRVSWFMPGHSIESFPEEAKAIAETGCEIGLHGYSHEDCAAMTFAQERDVLKNCIRIVEKLCGRKPVGYRAPLYTARQHTLDLLREYGLLYDASLNAHDSRPYFLPDTPRLEPIVPDYSQPASSWMRPLPQPDPVDPRTSLIEMPGSWYTEDMTPLAYYPYQPNSQGYVSTDVVEKMWWDRFIWLWENECDISAGDGDDNFGSWFSTIWHPESAGRSHIMPMIERFLARVVHFARHEAHDGEITFETMEEVARAFRVSETKKSIS